VDSPTIPIVWRVLITSASSKTADDLAVLVDADVRVVGASYSPPDSVLVTVEAATHDDAATLAEDVVRKWLPDRSATLASHVYDADGNRVSTDSADRS
jgi:hypothetical protein